MIDRQVSHMGRLLDDLLDISRITRGKITLRRETLDLRAVAQQALGSMRPMMEGRGQSLRFEGPSAALLVHGDPTRLEQIIRNLLHNAHKYTEAGGCITLSLGLQAGPGHQWRAVIRVSDSGIGIAPEMLPRVFEAFVQAEQGLARAQGGLGIGLPGMDGYQVAGHLRREPGSERVLIVALTGYGAEEDRRRAQEAGFDHHLTKPVALEQLQNLLNRSCAA